jgi:hypothetical protein
MSWPLLLKISLMNKGISSGRCDAWACNFGVNIGKTAMEVKFMITVAGIYWGKFGTDVGLTAMGVNHTFILGEMYWGN